MCKNVWGCAIFQEQCLKVNSHLKFVMRILHNFKTKQVLPLERTKINFKDQDLMKFFGQLLRS